MWNVAATMRRSRDRRAGWWSAAVLGALLTLPSAPAFGDAPRTERGDSKAAARSSASRSKASSAPRSRPRASSRASSAPRARPRAVTRERARPGRDSRATNRAPARPFRRSGAMELERSRPRRASVADERRAPRTRPAGPAPRHRLENEDPERGGVRPRGPGRGIRHDHPRGGYGHGGGHRHRHYYGCGHYGYGHYGYGYYGYGHDPFYFGFGYPTPFAYWGLGSYYGGSRYYAPDVYVSGGGSSRPRDAAMGALDLDVRPDEAEVYVDGNFVGVADQYDGYPSYLWLEEGTHELAFFHPGHETVFLRYTIYPGVTIDVDVRLREGESVRPGPPPGYAAGEAPADRDPGLPGGTDGGRIAIAATPADAAVYLDGHFVGTADEIAQLAAGLIVEPGDHLVEVTRPGYESRSVPVSVPVGEQLTVELELERR